jgi:hypothetical protein
MINKTSLKHPVMIKKIMRQTAELIRNGWAVDHVKNSKGVPVLAIRIRNGKALLTDRHGRNLTAQFAGNL